MHANNVPLAPRALMAPSWHAAYAPDRPAIVMGSGDITMTYAQLDERSRRFAGALRSRGLEVGDHLAILMGNNQTFLEVAWAAQRAGLYYTPINSHLRPGEIQYVLDDCRASALVTSQALADVVGRLDTSRIPLRISADGNLAGFEHYDDVLAAAPAGALDDECEGREMFYSSGTTGRPKGVRKPLPGTSFGVLSSVPADIARGLTAGSGSGDAVYLCPAPLYHSAPLVGSMSWHRVGGTVVLMEKFDARECLRLIDRYRVTDAQFVPTMFVRLLRLPRAERERYDLSSLRTVLHTAAPCPVTVKREMLEWWGPVIHEYYAGTEDLGATYISAQEWLAHPGSVGRPIDECHIVGPDGEELSTGQVGVVYFGGGRCFEYHGDPDKTASVIHDKGWRTLGDMGYLDADGYLYLTDRAAHMIISGGGEHLSARDRERPGRPSDVADVAVIRCARRRDGRGGQSGCPTGGLRRARTEADLIGYCRRELATYKCPRTVDFVDELPRDPNGKLYKRLLRERYWTGHESRII